MKKWLTAVMLLALVLTAVGQQALRPPTADAQAAQARGFIPSSIPNADEQLPFQGSLGASVDFAPTPEYGKLVYDPRPHIVVRFDDGTAEQYDIIKNDYIPRGLSTALCINANTIGNAGKLTWAQIRDLRRRAAAKGCEVHIMQHTNDNMDWANGFGATNGTNVDATVADMEASFDPTTIIEETGYRPRFVVIPGDAGRYPWVARNRGFYERFLNKWGYWWSATDPGTDASPLPLFVPSNIQTAGAGLRDGNDIPAANWLRPGSLAGPHYFSQNTLDLGNTFIETPTAAQWQAAVAAGHIGIDRNNPFPAVNGGDGWTLLGKTVRVFGDFNNADSDVYPLSIDGGPGFSFYAGSNDSIAEVARRVTLKDFRHHLYNYGLATNSGGFLGFHGEDRSYESPSLNDTGDDLGFDVSDSTLSFVAGTTDVVAVIQGEQIVGSMEHSMIAYILRKLVDKGHIVVCGPEEMAKWVMGRWADGVDIIGNPNGIVPQFDIGDTIGPVAEYFTPRGWSGYGRVFTTFNSGGSATGSWNAFNQAAPTAVSGVGALELERGAGTGLLVNRLYPNSPGLYESRGGVLLGAGTKATWGRVTFGPLPPGSYDVSFGIWQDGALDMWDFLVQGIYRFADHVSMFEATSSTDANFSQAYTDSIFPIYEQNTTMDFQTDGTLFPNLREAYNPTFRFRIPKDFPAARVPAASSVPVGQARGALTIMLTASTGDSLLVDELRMVYRED